MHDRTAAATVVAPMISLVLLAGCASEIASVSPTRVAADGVIVVEGKRMSDKLAVWIAGGPVPVSTLDVTEQRDKVGRFSFRMPVADANGQTLRPGTYEATIRVGSTTKKVPIELAAGGAAPEPQAVQHSARVTAEGEGALMVGGSNLRWPLQLRVEPIVPHADEFRLALDELRYASEHSFVIPLPYGTLQLASFRVYVQNSVRYGGRWSDAAVAVYKP